MTKAQAMRARFGPPFRGPRDCWRTFNVAGVCYVCGCHPEPVHIPLHAQHVYCATHCTACNPPAIDHEAVALDGAV